jgi:hypothetical protein
MDQKKTEKVDIERSKELFEYEMTEVLLMLKGEFAAVSGKELDYARHHVSKEQMELPLSVLRQGPIPAVEVRLDALCAELLPKIKAQPAAPAAQAVTVAKPQLVLPAIRKPEILPQIRIAPVTPPCLPAVPRAVPPVPGQIPAPSCPLPRVRLPKQTALPKADIPTLSVAQIRPEIPAVTRFEAAVPNPQIAPVCVSVPDTAAAVTAADAAVRKLQQSAVPTPVRPPVPSQTAALNLKIPKVDAAPVSLSPAAVSLPRVPKTVTFTLPQILPEPQAKVFIPSVPRCNTQRQFKAAGVQQLPPVAVPAKPDVQQQLREILAAAHN